MQEVTLAEKDAGAELCRAKAGAKVKLNCKGFWEMEPHDKGHAHQAMQCYHSGIWNLCVQSSENALFLTAILNAIHLTLPATVFTRHALLQEY